VDTRSKILTSADSLPRPITLVAGYFDVLRAAHAGEMQEVRDRTGSRPLVAVVLPCPGELLNQRARAELVAAIRVVDYVLIADNEELHRLIERLNPAEVVRLEEADRRRTRRLIEHAQHEQTR
jgi:glycerol-3-phosphate cytidylyltransferase-like family protein